MSLTAAVQHGSPAIQIDAVHKKFSTGKDSLLALNNVSLNIQQGEFFGLLGPNGAGKSTLINIIAGLTRATSGRVQVMGKDVLNEYRLARQQLGVVPQEVVYDPFFTVQQMLELQSGYFGLSRTQNQAWVDELLFELDLADKANTTLRALSGGMKRRLLIAQALVHKPPVVILDEPTAGVDVELRRTLWKFARRLHADGHTIVLTTHYLEEAEDLCDRIAVMRRGEIKALESKEVLMSRNPYRLVTFTMTNEADVHRLQASGGLPQQLQSLVLRSENEQINSQNNKTPQDNKRLQLKLHREKDALGDVMQALQSVGLSIQDIVIKEPSLEDVFIDLTGDSELNRSADDSTTVSAQQGGSNGI